MIAGDYMSIFTEIIDTDSASFIHGTKTFTIIKWEGVCEIEKLAVVSLPEESPIRNQLVECERNFVKYAIGPHYLNYTGNMFCNIWFGTTNFKSESRVMIDSVSFSKINPNFNDEKSVKEEELFMCVLFLYGFSFTTKKWGQLYVEFLDEISFDDDAFDQLVMDPIKKDLIFSLVTSTLDMCRIDHFFTSAKHKGVDLISGKGSGCVFLLHNPPGVRKTLTAEAISKYLYRPLYAVSVRELGTSVVELEHKLSEILEVASIWNAVILIDEVKCFDATFQSRISVALKYNDLDTDGKNKSQVDIENLKKRPLNGREIKTAMRLAKALTIKDNSDVLITTKQLETIFDILKSFSEELEI
ncbi:hypothetical protein RhiirC2_796822 [Rhizophagus irregularis]|uniref:ATPase AAA-type core domain-containing protein n=1 Tax=Rhizophagus irregularis TaxID=588596 RepID=A0A2N1M910_9GLOM|nr:hypothetical protein RhiirC2_796822 [Rhizophagus irregularis]